MGGPVLPSPSGKMKDRLNAFVLETPHTRSPTSTLAGEAIPRRRGDDIEAVYGESPFLIPHPALADPQNSQRVFSSEKLCREEHSSAQDFLLNWTQKRLLVEKAARKNPGSLFNDMNVHREIQRKIIAGALRYSPLHTLFCRPLFLIGGLL